MEEPEFILKKHYVDLFKQLIELQIESQNRYIKGVVTGIGVGMSLGILITYIWMSV
jgi:uncharacterized membrane protein